MTNKEKDLWVDSLEITFDFDLNSTVRRIKLDMVESIFVLYHIHNKDDLRSYLMTLVHDERVEYIERYPKKEEES